MSHAALSVQTLSFRYRDGQLALDGLSFDLNKGEVLGVIGPNGAGKSTLARLLIGLDVPTSGDVLLEGRRLRALDRNAIARHIAFVPQRDQVMLGYTSFEIVMLGRMPHLGAFGFELANDAHIAEEALRACEALQFRDRVFATLSGGEQKRVSIARALAQDTNVLVLDEPAAFLDIGHQISLLDLVQKRVREKNLACALVVHDLNLAAQYCDRLLLLSEGKMIALGSVEEVMTYRRMREAFGVDVYVGVNEITGARYFVPMRGST